MDFDTFRPIIAALVPLVLGFIVRFLMQGLKSISSAIDSLPAWAKQVTVVVIAALLTTLTHFFGVSPCEGNPTCGGIGDVTVAGLTAILSAIVAMVTHTGAKVSYAQKHGGFPPRGSRHG